MALTKTEVKTLKELRRKLRMGEHTVSFGMDKVVVHGKEVDVTAFIIERTKLWRDTWILSELDAMISKAEGK